MDKTEHGSIITDGPKTRDYLTATLNAFTFLAALLTILSFISPHVDATGVIRTRASIASENPRECLLESSNYSASVSGYMATVTVKQRFHNPNKEKMDATYCLPLPDEAAISGMTMKIGSRTIKGEIKESEEAREIYETARQNGQAASLLDQVRTNIFTQSVANIEAGKTIEVTLTYNEILPYAHGEYSLVIPTSVGARFIPANCNPGKLGGIGWFGEQPRVPIQIHADLSEGSLPISKINSASHHDIKTSMIDGTHAHVSYFNDHMDGKDVVINWQVAKQEMQSCYLTHKSGDRGFLTAMIMPPAKVPDTDAAPKEMLFIVDCSGSQSGAPIEKAKDTLNYIVDHMNQNDTFQIIAFNNSVKKNTARPMNVSAANKAGAHRFINDLQADGGTVMVPAIEAALSSPRSQNRLRIVTIMTDGFIGNDYDILDLVKKFRGDSRWFPFGTGNNVNRALIDGMAREGGGEPEYVLLDSSSEEIAKQFYDRISSPVLTDVTLSCEGVELEEKYPAKASDVWENRPLYFQASYKHGGKGALVLKGFAHGKAYQQKLPIVLPEVQAANASLAQAFARAKVDELMSMDWQGMQSGNVNPEIKKEIIDTSVKYQIMSQFASFVAVDSDVSVINDVVKATAEKVADVKLPVIRLHLEAFNPLPYFRPISEQFADITSQLNKLNSVTNCGTGPGGGYSTNVGCSTPTSAAQYNGSSSGANRTASNIISGQALSMQGLSQSCDQAQSGIDSVGENIVALAQYAWLLLGSMAFIAWVLLKNRRTQRRHAMFAAVLSVMVALNLPYTIAYLWYLAGA